MTDACYLRGHLVIRRRYRWYYESDGMLVDEDPERPCARCGRPPSPEGYDACMGHVPGAFSVCCGHGVHEPILIMECEVPVPANETITSHFRAG